MEQAHYGVGHMCAGCDVSNVLHTGCVVEGTVRVIRPEIPGGTTFEYSPDGEVWMTPGEEVPPLFPQG